MVTKVKKRKNTKNIELVLESTTPQLSECREEDLLVDTETWLAFVEPCLCNDSDAAETFAHLLQTITEAIENGPDGHRRAVCTLKDGIRLAYGYTKAHKAALKLYNLYLRGKLKSPNDEPLILIGAALERAEGMVVEQDQ